MSIITVIGSGMMGSSIVIPARENGHEVRLVGSPLDGEVIDGLKKDGVHKNLKRTLPEGMKYYYYEEFAEALADADLLISGVSSFGVDWLTENVLPNLPENLPVLSITKGMMNTSEGGFISYPEYYESLFPSLYGRIFAVGGPCTSYELADHDPTEVCFCGRDMEKLVWIRSLFASPYYHVTVTEDVRGVELSVALKNAYALAVSLAVGMAEKRDGKLHYNSQAALFGQSVREMGRLLAMNDAGTDALYVGAGDLYVTVFGGRTRLIGSLLGKGYSYEQALAELKGITLESTVITGRTIEAVRIQAKKGRVKEEDFPLLFHIGRVMDGDVKGEEIPWEAFAVYGK